MRIRDPGWEKIRIRITESDPFWSGSNLDPDPKHRKKNQRIYILQEAYASFYVFRKNQLQMASSTVHCNLYGQWAHPSPPPFPHPTVRYWCNFAVRTKTMPRKCANLTNLLWYKDNQGLHTCKQKSLKRTLWAKKEKFAANVIPRQSSVIQNKKNVYHPPSKIRNIDMVPIFVRTKIIIKTACLWYIMVTIVQWLNPE